MIFPLPSYHYSYSYFTLTLTPPNHTSILFHILLFSPHFHSPLLFCSLFFSFLTSPIAYPPLFLLPFSFLFLSFFLGCDDVCGGSGRTHSRNSGTTENVQWHEYKTRISNTPSRDGTFRCYQNNYRGKVKCVTATWCVRVMLIEEICYVFFYV